MSASIPLPPPPQGLPPPPRLTRSLRMGLILTSALVVGSIAAGVAFYSLHRLGVEREAAAGADQTHASGSGPTAVDLLADAPNGTEIPENRPRRPGVLIQTAHAAPVTTATPSPAAPAPTAVPDDMTDAAVAGRRAAWAAYYQQLAQVQQQRLADARAAMDSDIDPQVQAGNAGAPGAADTTKPSPTGTAAGGKSPTDFFSSVASNPATDYLPFTVTDPISPYELKQTDIITARLESGLNSDSPGEVRARVTKNVDDHATGMDILIPQGSILVGTYSTAVAYGQHRVMVAWQRVIFPAPCDQSLDLGAMPGSDQTGQAGFQDLTDNHLGQVFTSAILMSLFGAGVQLSQPPQSSFQQYNPVQTAGGAIGQQMGQLGQEFARKGLDIPPTERIRQGYEFSVMVTKDIAFAHPWVAGVCDSNSVEVALQ